MKKLIRFILLLVLTHVFSTISSAPIAPPGWMVRVVATGGLLAGESLDGVIVDPITANVYVTTSSKKLFKITPAGVVSLIGFHTINYNTVMQMAWGPDGKIYTADDGDNNIYSINPATAAKTFYATSIDPFRYSLNFNAVGQLIISAEPEFCFYRINPGGAPILQGCMSSPPPNGNHGDAFSILPNGDYVVHTDCGGQNIYAVSTAGHIDGTPYNLAWTGTTNIFSIFSGCFYSDGTVDPSTGDVYSTINNGGFGQKDILLTAASGGSTSVFVSGATSISDLYAGKASNGNPNNSLYFTDRSTNTVYEVVNLECNNEVSITCPPNVTVAAVPNTCSGFASVGQPVVSETCPKNALDFDGVNDGVTVATGYPATDELTIELWINPRVINNWDVMVNHDTWSVIGKLHFQLTPSGVIEFAVFGNNPTNQHASSPPAPNTWTHIAAVYSKAGKYVKFYKNGVFTNQANYSTAVTLGLFPYRVGNWDGTNRFFDGKMDELRIWNVQRTASEIQANMNKCLTGSEPGLMVYYPFNQGIAEMNNAGENILTDEAAAGGVSDGTLNNFALNGTSSNWVKGSVNANLSYTNNFNNTSNASGNYPVGKKNVKWTVTDCDGNSANCTMTVTVTGCNIPIQIYHIDTTATTATIKWKAQDACASGYQLRLRRELSPGVWGSWGSWTASSGPGLQHLFTLLMPGSFYNYQIRTQCFGITSTNVNGWFHTLEDGALKKEDEGIVQNFNSENLMEQKKMEESPSILKIKAIPNPAQDVVKVHIIGFNYLPKEFSMIEVSGKEIFKVTLDVSENSPELDLKRLSVKPGVYIIRVSDGKNYKTEQLIIQ